jgi:hypothetical protein
MYGCCGCGCVEAIEIMKADLTWSTSSKVAVLSDPDNIFSLNYIPAGKSITFNVEIGCSNFVFDCRLGIPSLTAATNGKVKVGKYLQYKHDVPYFTHPDLASNQTGAGATLHSGYKTSHLFIGTDGVARTDIRFRMSELDGNGSMFAMSGFKDPYLTGISSQAEDDNYNSANGTVKKPWAWSDNTLAIPAVEAGSRFIPITFTAGTEDLYPKQSILYAGGRYAFRTLLTPNDELCLVNDAPSSADYARTVTSSYSNSFVDYDPNHPFGAETIDLSLSIDDSARAGGDWTLIYDKHISFRTGSGVTANAYTRLYTGDDTVNWNEAVKAADAGALDATAGQASELASMKTLCADISTWTHATECPDPTPFWYKEPTYTSTWTYSATNATGDPTIVLYAPIENQGTGGTFYVYERPYHRGAYDVSPAALNMYQYYGVGVGWTVAVDGFKNWAEKFDSIFNSTVDYTQMVHNINDYLGRLTNASLVTPNALFCPAFTFIEPYDNEQDTNGPTDIYRDRQYIAANTATNITVELYASDVTLTFKRLSSINDWGTADENITNSSMGHYWHNAISNHDITGTTRQYPWYSSGASATGDLTEKPWVDPYIDNGLTPYYQIMIKDGVFEVVSAKINGTDFQAYDICTFFDGDISDSRYDYFHTPINQYWNDQTSSPFDDYEFYRSGRNIVTMTKDGDSVGFKLGIGRSSSLTGYREDQFLGAILSDGTVVSFDLTPYHDLRVGHDLNKYGKKTIEFPYISGGTPDDFLKVRVRH